MGAQNYLVSEVRSEAGLTWADVHDMTAHYAGRIVHVEPSDTWRPNEELAIEIGAHVWASYDEARKALEML